MSFDEYVIFSGFLWVFLARRFFPSVIMTTGKTHEKPLYDGLRSALPVGANVVI